MAYPVLCREGRCRYRKNDFLDACIDCDIVEQIEHDLLVSAVASEDRPKK